MAPFPSLERSRLERSRSLTGSHMKEE